MSQPVKQEAQKWRTDSEHSGAMRVLEWGGVTRTTAQWPKKWAALYRGSLYVLDSEDATAAPTVHNVWTSTRYPLLFQVSVYLGFLQCSVASCLLYAAKAWSQTLLVRNLQDNIWMREMGL